MTNGFALNHDKSLQIYFFCLKRQAKNEFLKDVKSSVVHFSSPGKFTSCSNPWSGNLTLSGDSTQDSSTRGQCINQCATKPKFVICHDLKLSHYHYLWIRSRIRKPFCPHLDHLYCYCFLRLHSGRFYPGGHVHYFHLLYLGHLFHLCCLNSLSLFI